MLAKQEGRWTPMRPTTAMLASVIIALLVLTSGCLGGDDEPEVKIELKLMGEETQNVVQGNNTTFVFTMENNWKDDAVLVISAVDPPKDWGIDFLPSEATLEKHKGTAVRMNVSVPDDAPRRGHDIKVRARAKGSDIHKDSITVTVFTLDATISHGLDVVEPGSTTIYVNYTGFLSDGRVFDTTNEEIALSSSVEKTDDFQGRADYSAAPFKAGQGQLIKGWERSWLNMRKGEYKSFFVPEEEAYSIYRESTINLTETVPMKEFWSTQEFKRAFRQEPAMWLVVTHRKWNWTAQVVAIADDEETTVTLQLQVKPGDTTETYGWESEVVSVDSTADGGRGTIVLRHHPGEVGSEAQLYNASAPVEYDFGKVTGLTDTTVTVRVQSSHHALAGEDLIFVVKIHDFQ